MNKSEAELAKAKVMQVTRREVNIKYYRDILAISAAYRWAFLMQEAIDKHIDVD